MLQLLPSGMMSHHNRSTNDNNANACRPPPNNTYLVIGQDLFSINEYVNSQYNYSLHHLPNSTDGVASISSFVPSGKSSSSSRSIVSMRLLLCLFLVVHRLLICDVYTIVNLKHHPNDNSAFMIYTDLATLDGLWEPTDYGSGVEFADGILNQFPSHSHHDGNHTSTGLQIGLWLNGTQGCFSICEDEMNDQINRLISYLEFSRASKIFLRIGYEFDNPAFGYSDDPALYILAFRKIVTDIRENLSEEARSRVLFVWHSWGAPMANKGLSLKRFYPGNDFVDWIGVSIFQQVFPWSPSWGGTMDDVENVLDFAVRHGKPTMIAESTPFGGIELKQTSKDTIKFLEKNKYEHNDWDRWYGKVIDIINKYDVSMWSYINCNWDNEPMWHNVGFGETRLSSNDHVMSQWFELVAKNGVADRRFLFDGSLENCGTVPHVFIEDPRYISFNYSHFTLLILFPLLVASGAFFIPLFFLDEKNGRRCKPSEKGEKRSLLARLDENNKSSPTKGV